MASAVQTVEASPEQGSAPARGKRRLVLIGLPVLLVILLAAGAWLLGILPHRHAASATSGKPITEEKPAYVDLQDIIANLDSGSHRAVFIKLKARIVIAHVSEQPAVVAAMPRILDAFQTYLRAMRPDEIHGGQGTYRLREALMNRIDVIIAPIEVQDLLFVEVLVQ